MCILIVHYPQVCVKIYNKVCARCLYTNSKDRVSSIIQRGQTANSVLLLEMQLKLFISQGCLPEMLSSQQLVSAPLNPIPTVEHFRRSHPQCEHS